MSGSRTVCLLALALSLAGVFSQAGCGLLLDLDPAEHEDGDAAAALDASVEVGVLDARAGNDGPVGDSGMTRPLCARPKPLEVADLDAGSTHTCLIAADGSLWCWGGNSGGALGVGDRIDRWEPTLVHAGPWRRVSAGASHTCAILARDRSLWCWGTNAHGELGTGGADALSPELVLPGATWLAVSAGDQFTVAVRTTAAGIDTAGSLWAWGSNARSQLGTGDTTSTTVPVLADATAMYRDVSVGAMGGCARTTVDLPKCWGVNTYGECGTGATTIGFVEPIPAYVMSEEIGYQVVSRGADFTVSSHNGGLFSWGHNAFGTLGTGDLVDRSTPSGVPFPPFDWVSVAAGAQHACGIAGDRVLRCWGAGTYGELGLGPTPPVSSPTPVGADADWVTVTAGSGFTCGAHAGGRLACWGANGVGQLGLGVAGAGTERDTPADACW